jgi:hypothetical protein
MVEQKGMQSIALHRRGSIAGKSVIITGRGTDRWIVEVGGGLG